MEPDKRQKVVDLVSNKILSIAMNSNLNPPARLRQIAFLMDTYADAILKDYIEELKKKFPAAAVKIDGQ